MKNALELLMQSDYYKDMHEDDNPLNFIKFEPTTPNKKFIDHAFCLIANSYRNDVQIRLIDSELNNEYLQISKTNYISYHLNKSEATQLRDYLNEFLEE